MRIGFSVVLHRDVDDFHLVEDFRSLARGSFGTLQRVLNS